MSNDLFAPNYRHWFVRFLRISFARKKNHITDEDLKKYQMFLLEHGQVNANFTLDELKRLQYSLSPVVAMKRHTYLRSSDNWAMQVLQKQFILENNLKLVPVFVHSNVFFDELKRYSNIIDVSKSNEGLEEQIIRVSESGGEAWVHLGEHVRSDEFSKKIENIKNAVRATIADYLWRANKVSDDLKDLLCRVQQSEKIDWGSISHVINNELAQLIPLAVKIKSKGKRPRLVVAVNINNESKGWFKQVYNLAKHHGVVLPNSIVDDGSFMVFAKKPESSVALKKIVQDINSKVDEEQPKRTFDEGEIRKWYGSAITIKLDKIMHKIVYVATAAFRDITTLVVYAHDNLPTFVKNVIDYMGYRYDPVSAIRKVLEQFPGLFSNDEETRNFWQQLVQITQFKGFSVLERQNLDALIYSVNREVKSEQPSYSEKLASVGASLGCIREVLNKTGNAKLEGRPGIGNSEAGADHFLYAAVAEYLGLNAEGVVNTVLQYLTQYNEEVEQLLAPYDCHPNQIKYDFEKKSIKKIPVHILLLSKALCRSILIIDSSNVLQACSTTQFSGSFPIVLLEIAEHQYSPLKPKPGYTSDQMLRNIVLLVKLSMMNFTLINLKRSPSVDFSSFELYGRLMISIVLNYLDRPSPIPGAEFIIEPEINEAIDLFLQACQCADLSKTIRCAQSLLDILLLQYEFSMPNNNLLQVINDNYFQQENVQAVMMTPYAMRSFVRVLQILSPMNRRVKLNIFSTNQGYFEWLNSLERLDRNWEQVTFIRNLNEVTNTPDVVFLELHPNNVVEAQQYAHDLSTLLLKLNKPEWSGKRLTLVIDVTLNALNDSEIQEALSSAERFVNDGLLNIILIQSLTKFTQLGLDKRSAGMLIVINNGKDWPEVCERSNTYVSLEMIDASTIHFFIFFMAISLRIRQYISSINANVRFVYTATMDRLNKLQVSRLYGFQLTISNDQGACYVALNMAGLIPHFDKGFSLSTDENQIFSRDLLDYFLFPLCEFLNLPISERMSIGFPLSSINIVMDTLRLTIGLEPKLQLQCYADILTYISFVINRSPDYGIYFVNSHSDTFESRRDFFKEKVEQFKAMTPGGNYHFVFQFPKGRLSCPSRDLMCRLRLNNGAVEIFRELPSKSNSDKLVETRFYQGRAIQLLTNKGEPVFFYDKDVDMQTRRMAIACLRNHPVRNHSSLAYSDSDESQNVRLQFDEATHRPYFPDFVLITRWDAGSIYGPYFAVGSSIPFYFHLHRKQVIVLHHCKGYDPKRIFIIKGVQKINLPDMPCDQIEILLRTGSSKSDSPDSTFASWYPTFIAQFYRPYSQCLYKASIQNNILNFECITMLYSGNGVNVFSKYDGPDRSLIEVDYWFIKEPKFARFFRFLTLMGIRDILSVAILPKDHQYRFCLVGATESSVRDVCIGTIDRLIDIKEQLIELIESYVRLDNSQYPLNTHSSSPSGGLIWKVAAEAPSHVYDKRLIDSALSIAKFVPAQAASTQDSAGLTRRALSFSVTQSQASVRGGRMLASASCASGSSANASSVNGSATATPLPCAPSEPSGDKYTHQPKGPPQPGVALKRNNGSANSNGSGNTATQPGSSNQTRP